MRGRGGRGLGPVARATCAIAAMLLAACAFEPGQLPADPDPPVDAATVDADGDGPRPVDARVDGGIEPIGDARGCAEACAQGSCDSDGVCVITCGEAGACGAMVVCPAEVPCRVVCTGPESCAGGVQCGSAACTVTCTGADSCEDELRCGTGPCAVTCDGAGSCDNGTSCAQACQCDVRCPGAGACSDEASCPGTPACDTGDGCTSGPGACDHCA